LTQWVKVAVATVVPLASGAGAWVLCSVLGVGSDTTGIVVGLVVLLPGTPLAIWAGQSDGDTTTTAEVLPAPAVIGDIPREPKAFRRRPALQQQVDRHLNGGDAVVCALVGAKGVGKSHLAAAYARRSIGRGVPVAWLNAESDGQLTASIELMAAELGLMANDPALLVSRVRRWLEERSEPYLLVIDNAIGPERLMPLLPSRGAARVLITANDLAFERIAGVVPVDRFAADEALAYLVERVGRAGDISAVELVEELDRLPLALTIATAALIGPPALSYADYLLLVRSTAVDVLLERPRGQAYPRGVAESILLSLADTSAPAAALLAQLAVMSASGVAVELVADDRITLAELAARSLVTFTADDSVILVHRLVRRVIQDSAFKAGTLRDAVAAAAARLQAVEQIPEADTWRRLPVIRALSEHTAALWESAERLLAQRSEGSHTVAESVLEIRSRVLYHYLYLNDGPRAIPIAEKLVDGWAAIAGEDDPRTLVARSRLAQAVEQAGDAERAVELYSEVVARQTELIGVSARDTLRSRSGLAMAMIEAGRAVEAVDLLEQLVSDQSQVLPEDDVDSHPARFAQAYALVHAGQPGRGADLFRALAADQEWTIGAEDADTLVTKGRIAWADVASGHPERGLPQYETVLRAQRRLIGADHPDTLITEHGMAAAYENLGRLAEAATHYAHLATRYEAALGPSHPLMVAASNDLARVGKLQTSGL
jgi:tetratricopeptide (TPR) repeat protein